MSERSPVTDTVAKVGLLLFNFLVWGVFLGDLWGLYSSEPLIPALKGWWPGMTSTFYLWGRVALELFMLGLLTAIFFRAYRWRKAENPPLSLSLPPSAPSTSHTPTPRFPQLTTIHIAALIEAVHPHALRIKLVSIPAYLFFAEDLERALRIAGCRFVPDPETNKTIFLARSLHPHNQVVLRYQNSDTDAMLNFTYFTLTQTLESICAFQFAFRFLTTATRLDLFPPESSIDHFQIEIGGAP